MLMIESFLRQLHILATLITHTPAKHKLSSKTTKTKQNQKTAEEQNVSVKKTKSAAVEKPRESSHTKDDKKNTALGSRKAASKLFECQSCDDPKFCPKHTA